MTMNVTLKADGVVIEEGSVEAVAHFEKELRLAFARLSDASAILGWTPTEVQPHWRKRYRRALDSLGRFSGDVSRFHEDYARNGRIEEALADARLRKEIPPA